MKLYIINRTRSFPISIERAWDFFSNPANLAVITPPSLGLQLTSDLPQRMYPGMIITYVLTPVLGIKVDWVTEITHVEKPYLFVDEQRFGPYRFWHHTHLFDELEGGVEMQDIVHYALPLGYFGRVLHEVFIKNQLKTVFDYREKVLTEMFGAIDKVGKINLIGNR